MTHVPTQIPKIPQVIKQVPPSDQYLPEKVLKFGGSSMQYGLEGVVNITFQNLGYRPIVVVSAFKGVTDELISLADECFEQIRPILKERLRQENTIRLLSDYRKEVEFSKKTFSKGLGIAIKYASAAESLGLPAHLIYDIMWRKGGRDGPPMGLQKQIIEFLEDFDKYVSLFYDTVRDRAAKELEIDINGIFQNRSGRERLYKRTSDILMEEAKLYMRDKFVFWGEFSSSFLLSRKAQKEGKKFLLGEASDLGLLTEMVAGGAVIADDTNMAMRQKFREAAKRHYDLYVIGGYIAKGRVVKDSTWLDRHTIMLRTTLGRGGSDLTAVACGAALGIPVFLYSDVDGVKDANPNLVANPRTIERLSREEGVEFGSFGSKVLYARAMEYALRYGVDMLSLNTFNPSRSGTIITGTPLDVGKPRGISFLERDGDYVLAVIGHGIGSNSIEVDRILGVMRSLYQPATAKVNPHSVVFELPKDFVKQNAQVIYQRVIGS